MESKKINQLATELTPALDDLTIIGDPTTGISKKITLSQMASLFTGTVEEYANLAEFPLVGVADTIYIALDTNVLYRWDTGLTSYVELSPNIINSLVFNDANGFDGTIALVGSVATLTITTALTTGSVGFIGASGALLQDNANFFWDDTNNRLGLGTNAPTTAIDVFGSGIIGRLNGTSTNNAFLGFASAGSNKWSIGNVQSDHRFRIYNEATTSELVSVLQTGEFGIGIANPTTKLHIDGGSTALIANLDANVSVAKSVSFRSDNSNRFNIEVSGTESGSNAGANFFIRRYSDAGSLLSTPITITRSTGQITITSTLNIGSATSIDGSDGRIITDKIRLYNGTPASVYHDFVSAATSNRSITIPDLSGTMALLENTQTFSGAKTFSSLITSDISSSINAIFNSTNANGGYIVFRRSNTDIGYLGNSAQLGVGVLNALELRASNDLILSTTSGLLRITSGGVIAIGPTSNQVRISSQGTFQSATLDAHIINSDGTGAYSSGDLLIQPRSYSGGGANSIVFATSNNGNTPIERMRILSAGKVAIYGGGDDYTMNLINSRTLGYGLYLQAGNGSTYTAIEAYNYNGSTNIFRLTGGGVLYAQNTTIQAISDVRTKENIVNSTDGLDIINALRPVRFDFKEGFGFERKNQLGFIAQEVEQVFPEIVDEWKFKPEDEITYKTVGPAGLIPVLVKAIQELKTEIDILKNK